MADKKIIYSMNNVGKVYDKKPIIKDVSLSYYHGAKIGVLGSNGSGKSTLLKIMAGVDQNYLGETHLSKGHSIGYLEQEPLLENGKTVKEIVQQGAQETVDLIQNFEDISMKLCEPMSDDEMNKLLMKQADLQDKLDASDAWDLDSKLEQAMDSLRCPPNDSLVDHLSGGEKRRVALCRLLMQEPSILLLDEPTNHLDAETVQWLERHLQAYKGTVIAVTHDRYFLDNVAGWILELDRGRGIPWEGNYSSWLEQKRKRLAVEEKQETKRQKSLEREAEWIKSSPRARHAKSKARITNYSKLLEEGGREKTQDTNELFIPAGPRLGDLVIDADSIGKSFGEKLLFENLSFKLPPGGIVGVIGANGAGKTTLFKILAGLLEVDKGTYNIGETVKLAYIDQNRDLNEDKTILEVVGEGQDFIQLGKREINPRAYIAKFNFNGDDHHKSVKNLSGGERNRVHLACTLKSQANVLFLDEPTNDLDVNTLRALEEALDSFAGCAVVISHDRFFLDRVATHMLAFEGNGEVVWFDGNFSQYEEDRKRRLGDEATRPKRYIYKKLVR